MTKLRLKLLLLTLVAALSLGAVAYAATFSTAKENSAFAQPTAADPSIFDMAFGLRENDSDVVDESNSATAYSTCDGCRAIAIAFQVVIVQSKPSTVTPTNVALAVNEGCSDCSVLALAYQWVIGKGEPARITSRGRRQLAAVADDMLRVERDYEDYTDAEIESKANAAAAKVGTILDAELVAVDHKGKPDVTKTRRADRG
jgi:putative peptide zinc metalloprotease protein